MNPTEYGRSSEPIAADPAIAPLAKWQEEEEELLRRTRLVGRRITERVRRVMDDGADDRPAPPTDPTEEVPPV
jgi:hypothetical protein